MDNTNAERQRRYIARLKAAAAGVTNAADASEVAKLKAELTQARARIAELERLKAHTASVTNATNADELAAAKAELALAKTRIAELEREQRKTVEAAAAKAAKPPLPPDAERERIIKGLRTRVRNLTADVQAAWAWAGSRTGDMNFKTMSAIAKALMPDGRKHLTRAELDAELDAACRVFTAWKADRDKVRSHSARHRGGDAS